MEADRPPLPGDVLAYRDRPVLVPILEQRLLGGQFGRLGQEARIITGAPYQLFEAVEIDLPATLGIEQNPAGGRDHGDRNPRADGAVHTMEHGTQIAGSR